MHEKVSRRQVIKKTAGGSAFLGMGGCGLIIQGCSKGRSSFMMGNIPADYRGEF